MILQKTAYASTVIKPLSFLVEIESTAFQDNDRLIPTREFSCNRNPGSSGSDDTKISLDRRRV